MEADPCPLLLFLRNDGLSGLAKWFSSIFAARNSQQLYSVGSTAPAVVMPLGSTQAPASHAWGTPPGGAGKAEMFDQAAHSRDVQRRPSIRSGVLALGRPTDGVETFALVPV